MMVHHMLWCCRRLQLMFAEDSCPFNAHFVYRVDGLYLPMISQTARSCARPFSFLSLSALPQFAAGIWVFLQPFEACFGFIRDANSCIEQYVVWPRKVGQAIADCSSSCPQP
jgi:hypothetical protein